MHIYAFGSICRGEMTADSDVDLLAIVSGHEPRLDAQKFSIYSYERIDELWCLGNAFAWHLARESKLIYASDGVDYLSNLGMPAPYTRASYDCARFRDVFLASLDAIEKGSPSLVFEMSCAFLAIRNIATCYSLRMLSAPTFGRDSALRLGQKNVPISSDMYMLLRRARVLSTRGVGPSIDNLNITELINELRHCQSWIDMLCREVANDG